MPSNKTILMKDIILHSPNVELFLITFENRSSIVKCPFISRNSVKINSTPDEPYNSFIMNSFHKANFYSQFTDMIILSDDSGIEVECLDNQPGVKSARYGGPELSDYERNNYLISNLPNTIKKPKADINKI